MVEFSPSEIWCPDTEEIDEPIERARYEINKADPRQLIYSLQEKTERAANGVLLAVLDGNKPREYSKTSAMVLCNSFGNGITPNPLVRGEFIRLVAKERNIHDNEGRLLPVFILASTGQEDDTLATNLRLYEDDRARIRQGELRPYAQELLRAVCEKRVGEVAIFGFSQGADMALAAARSAYSGNLDVQSVAIGDPVAVENRSVMKLGADFSKSGSLDEAIRAGGMPAQRLASQMQGERLIDYARWIISVHANPLNKDVIKGLSANTFEQQATELVTAGKIGRLIVGYGSRSAITKSKAIEPALQRLQELDSNGILTSIRVDGASHNWSDHLLLIAKLYMQAFE